MNRSKKMATAICGMFAVGAGLMFGRPAILADEFPPPDTELNDLPGDLPMGRYIEYIATDVSTNSVTLSNGVLVVGSEALDLFEMTNLTYEAAVRDAAEGTKEAIGSFSNEMAKVSFSGDYSDLTNKPSLNGVVLDGEKRITGAEIPVDDALGSPNIAMALGQKLDKPAAFNTGNLAEFDSNGNPVDSFIAATNVALKTDISPTEPAFSNAVLSVGLGIDTNTVAVINELVDSAHGLPLTGATSVGALLLALAAAIAALKRGKADCVSPATDGDIAALDASGNLKLSGMNRDGNGNLDATEFTFTPSQVADYDSASVGTVINKATTPVVLHDGQHYVARKSFVKTNGGWNVDSVTGRVVLPGASGIGSTALGDATQAMGSGAVSTGKNTKASGAGAVSSGQETDAIGTGAHAEGQSTSATATCAHSEGYFTIAQNQSEHAQGEYNASHTGATESERTLNSIGIGDSTERKNAVEVMRDGKVFVVGIGGYDGTNPTVSGVLDLATAVKSDLRYSLVTKTISGGAVTLDDRADNYVDARTLGSSDSLDIDFPALVDGKSRDFVLAVECGANPPTISYAAFVTIMAEDASTLTPEEGMNIYAFKEFKTNMFIASRKLISTVVDNSPESGVQLLLAMQKRGIDTTGITDFGGVEAALGLGDTDTPQDAIDAVMN